MEIKHRDHLYKLLPENSIAVEIGVAEGNFSRDILNWPNIAKLYSIDSWKTLNQKGDGGSEQTWHDANYTKAMSLLTPFGERSVVLRQMSSAAVFQFEDNSVDFIHLDGDHSYDGVLSDLIAWYPKMKSGAVISGHDYLMTQYGVQQAVTDFTKKMGVKEVFVMPENKPEDAGFYFLKP